MIPLTGSSERVPLVFLHPRPEAEESPVERASKKRFKTESPIENKMAHFENLTDEKEIARFLPFIEPYEFINYIAKMPLQKVEFCLKAAFSQELVKVIVYNLDENTWKTVEENKEENDFSAFSLLEAAHEIFIKRNFPTNYEDLSIEQIRVCISLIPKTDLHDVLDFLTPHMLITLIPFFLEEDMKHLKCLSETVLCSLIPFLSETKLFSLFVELDIRMKKIFLEILSDEQFIYIVKNLNPNQKRNLLQPMNFSAVFLPLRSDIQSLTPNEAALLTSLDSFKFYLTAAVDFFTPAQIRKIVPIQSINDILTMLKRASSAEGKVILQSLTDGQVRTIEERMTGINFVLEISNQQIQLALLENKLGEFLSGLRESESFFTVQKDMSDLLKQNRKQKKQIQVFLLFSQVRAPAYCDTFHRLNEEIQFLNEQIAKRFLEATIEIPQRIKKQDSIHDPLLPSFSLKEMHDTKLIKSHYNQVRNACNHFKITSAALDEYEISWEDLIEAELFSKERFDEHNIKNVNDLKNFILNKKTNIV